MPQSTCLVFLLSPLLYFPSSPSKTSSAVLVSLIKQEMNCIYQFTLKWQTLTSIPHPCQQAITTLWDNPTPHREDQGDSKSLILFPWEQLDYGFKRVCLSAKDLSCTNIIQVWHRLAGTCLASQGHTEYRLGYSNKLCHLKGSFVFDTFRASCKLCIQCYWKIWRLKKTSSGGPLTFSPSGKGDFWVHWWWQRVCWVKQYSRYYLEHPEAQRVTRTINEAK